MEHKVDRGKMAKTIRIVSTAVLLLSLLSAGAIAQSRFAQVTKKLPSIHEDPSGPATIFYKKAKNFWEKGDFIKAAETYKQITRLWPDDPVAFGLMGFAYEYAGQYHEAITAFKEAIRLKPDFGANYLGLGENYLKINRYEDAVEAFKQAIRLTPDDAAAHSSLAFAYGEMASNRGRVGHYEEVMPLFKKMVEEYKQAIRLRPDDANAHLGLGMGYLIFNDRGAALEEYKILQKLDKERANLLFNNIYK
jgi:tetratricopeptide (TPR) repeat protein